MADGETIEPLHFDCVVCQARAREVAEEPGEETLILLVLLFTGIPLEQMKRDLCFEHRRRVRNAVNCIEEEPPVAG